MNLSHLNALRALEATLRHGSFTGAAQELGITPAAAGQRVRALENYLGQALFDRSPTGIAARPEATQVAATLTAGFSSLADALGQLRNRAAAPGLALTLPASFAENWLTPAIPEFYRRHAEIDLRLDASNRDVDLLTEPFDFAIRYGAEPAPPLEYADLFGDWLLPVATPDFVAEHGLTPDVRSLRGVPLVHVLNRTRDPGWVGFDGWGAAFGFDPVHLGHGVRFSQVGSGLQAALSGQGLVLGGLVEAFRALQSGALVAPFGPAMRLETTYRYRLVRVPGRRTGPLQEDFRHWLLDKAAIFTIQADRYLGGGMPHVIAPSAALP